MRYVALLLIVATLQIGGRSMEWKKVDELKESLAGYNKSAEKLFQMTLQAMYYTKLKAAQFIEQLSSSYLLTTSKLNETVCYQSLFDLKRLQRSFQSELLRFQVPLENLLVELRGKLEGINNTINMCHDLADSKFVICKVMNKSEDCEEDTDLWLEGIISTVRCQFSTSCTGHSISKRSPANYCPVDTFVCDAKRCISPKSVCDGKPDCSDGTDESRCCHNNNQLFYCKEKDSCIDTSKVCDGHDDCGENSDERHCGRIMMNNCSIENGMHKCDSEKCIGLEQVCDGNKDCQDGSDEGYHCGMGICPEECTKKGGVCFHGPRGPLCFGQCPLGTFESPEGCTAHPQPTDRTVIELLEDIPSLAYRQNAKYSYLKMKAIATVSKMISDVFKCLDPYYPILSKVLSFPIYNNTDEGTETTNSEEKNESGVL